MSECVCVFTWFKSQHKEFLIKILLYQQRSLLEPNKDWNVTVELRERAFTHGVLLHSLIRDPIHPFFHLSIHPFSATYSGSSHIVSILSRKAQTSLSPAILSSSQGRYQGVRQLREIVSPASLGSCQGPPTRGTCPEHLTREASVRRPSRLIWPLSMHRSRGFTPSFSQMAALKVMEWCSQQDHYICKKQESDPKVTNQDPLNIKTPRNSVQKDYEKNQWQKAALVEFNSYWKYVQFPAHNANQALTRVKRDVSGCMYPIFQENTELLKGLGQRPSLNPQNMSIG